MAVLSAAKSIFRQEIVHLRTLLRSKNSIRGLIEGRVAGNQVVGQQFQALNLTFRGGTRCLSLCRTRFRRALCRVQDLFQRSLLA